MYDRKGLLDKQQRCEVQKSKRQLNTHKKDKKKKKNGGFALAS
jgi:hypothetical protein